MCTAISPMQWLPWTAVLPFLTLISMAKLSDLCMDKVVFRGSLLVRQVQSTPLSASSTHLIWELTWLHRTVVLPWHVCWGTWIRSYPDLCASKFNKTNLKQGAHINQPTNMAATARVIWLSHACGTGQEVGWCMCAPCSKFNVL